MLRLSIAIAAILLCFGEARSTSAEQHPGGSGEKYPTFFSSDNDNPAFYNATQPSGLILSALLKTTQVRGRGLNELDRESQRKAFHVVPIDLGDAAGEDYIALGSKPVTGADNDWFWIVRVRQGRASVLLFTGTLTVNILPHKTNGHNDIRTFWCSGASGMRERFKYNGSVYKLASKRSVEIKP